MRVIYSAPADTKGAGDGDALLAAMKGSGGEQQMLAVACVVRDERVSAIVVEQNPRLVLPITERAIVLDRGAVVHEGRSSELHADRGPLDRWLAVGTQPAAAA